MLQLSHTMLTDLSLTPIAKVLKQLSAEGRSGDLQVNTGAVVKTVFFDHGRVVFAASNLKKDRLGEALVALGRITTEDFSRAAVIMKEQRRRLGDALIAAGILDKAELGTSVARQVRRTALSLFEFTDGLAAFEERPSVIPLEYMVSLSIHHLLYDGVKLMQNEGLVLTGLGPLDRRVRAALLPPFAFDARECPREEAEVLSRARNPVTLRALAWADGGLDPDRLRTVYALTASGVLADAEAKTQEEEPTVQTETGMFLLSVLRRRPDPSARDAIRLEVAQELDRSARLDREKWLKVSATAPKEQLGKALEEKMERYHALLDAIGDDEELRTDIELILGRASSLLRIARQELKLASSPPVPMGSFLLVAPEPAKSRSREPGSQPPHVPEDLLLEPPPPEAPEPAAVAPEKRAPGPPPGVPPGTSEVAANQAAYLLMEAEVRMTVADYGNAVRVYAKLVDLLPNVAAYHAKLAIAMACFPRTVKQAEREFLEAVRLDPRNADYHYQLGLYYKTMRLRARAVIEMRAALSLNPRHVGAREELEILSPRDSALKSLKKLFQ